MYGQMFRNLPPATKNLLIINIIVWAFTALVGQRASFSLENYAGLHYFSSPIFNPLQLITYMFVHANFTHLFFNMFALFMFGGILERTLGSGRFLFYYISCGLGAALIQEGVYSIMISNYAQKLSPADIDYIYTHGADVIKQGMNYTYPLLADFNLLLNNATIGASGAIFGILLAFGWLFPNMPLFLMFIPIPVKAKWMVAGYAVLELLLGISNRAGDNVAHFAHLGGMLIGILIMLYWKQKGLFRNRYY